MEKRFYDADEFAALTGLSRSGVYNLLRSGEIPCLRLGRRLLIPADVLKKTSNEAE